jgi:hypothetical protein
LGFCCAFAGALAAVPVINKTISPSQIFLPTLIADSFSNFLRN